MSLHTGEVSKHFIVERIRWGEANDKKDTPGDCQNGGRVKHSYEHSNGYVIQKRYI